MNKYDYMNVILFQNVDNLIINQIMILFYLNLKNKSYFETIKFTPETRVAGFE